MIEPRPEIRSAPASVHGGPLGSRDERLPVRVDFSVSLNAWGPAKAVRLAAREAPLDAYPDPESLAARRAAAERWRRPVEEVVFGAGAAELLHAVCFAFLRPGDDVVVATPTFGEYERAARLCGARVHAVAASPPLWALDTDRVVAEVRRLRPRLAFVCAPNNPTGHAPRPDELRAIADACAEAGTLLVLDQSYDAFVATPLGTPALPGHPSVLHLRSITKDHALAGVRAAYAVAPEGVAEALQAARVPWAASAQAQAAAVAALSEAGEAHLRLTLPRLRAERERLQAALARLGVRTVSSATHFFLFETASAATLAEALRSRHGIGVRDCTSFGLPRHVRVAARTPAENDLLLAALEAECRS